MGEKFIITKGLDKCLFGFSQTEWANFEEKLKTLPLTNKNARFCFIDELVGKEIGLWQ